MWAPTGKVPENLWLLVAVAVSKFRHCRLATLQMPSWQRDIEQLPQAVLTSILLLLDLTVARPGHQPAHQFIGKKLAQCPIQISTLTILSYELQIRRSLATDFSHQVCMDTY